MSDTGAQVLLFKKVNTREDEALEIFLPFLLLIIAFTFKKILLAITHTVPYEIAMILSGLWIENLDDTFQTLVFPVAADFDRPVVFFSLWLRKILENLAYLLFLTDFWFRFRVWIKGYLKSLFKKDSNEPPPTPIKEDLDPDDRGHSNQQVQRPALRFQHPNFP